MGRLVCKLVPTAVLLSAPTCPAQASVWTKETITTPSHTVRRAPLVNTEQAEDRGREALRFRTLSAAASLPGAAFPTPALCRP